MMNLGTEIFGSEKKDLQEKIEQTINPNKLDGLDFFENKLHPILKEELIETIINIDTIFFNIEHTRGTIYKLFACHKP